MDLRDVLDDAGMRSRIPVRELTAQLLDRIAARTPDVGAVVAVCPDASLREAERADRARAAGRPLALDGMPVVVKDNVGVEGVRCSCGSLFFRDRIADQDATVVRLLRRAGAVILGKAQSTEFMYALTAHPVYEPCRNPWDLGRIAGASSNGSAAALADDQAVGALGTDTGGSVRIPAAFTGTTALRPTFGVLSTVGVFPLARSLDVVGPMARSAADVTRLFAVLARFDGEDVRSVRFTPPDAAAPPMKVRIGVPRQFFFDGCDPEIETAVRAATEEMRRWGHPVVEVDLPLARTAHEGSTLLARAEALALHAERLLERPERFSVDVRDRLRLGESITARDVVLALQDMHAWRRQVEQVFATVDVVLTPTVQTPAPRVEDARLDRVGNVTRLTYPWSFAHVPALSLPCGFTSEGMPVGLHLAGPAHADLQLLAFARHVQARTEWHRHRPTTAAAPR